RTSQALGDVPVILGEFGLDTTLPGALEYVRDVYQMADQHSFGVAYWSRDDGAWGPYEDGEKRNLVGALARPYPRAIAGDIGSISASSTKRTFEGTADTESSAPSEVWLPPTFGKIGAPGDRASRVDVDGAAVLGWDARGRVLLLQIHDDARTVTIG